MYGLEELRCDLTAFNEAVKLEAEGFPQGRDVQYAILFDRLFRFPVTGDRVRNYDGLGGQLLFAYLHKHDALRWTDNSLQHRLGPRPQVTVRSAREIETLYRDGIDRPKLVHWFAAYELVAAYLAPHPGSAWAKGPDALDLTLPPRKLVDEVLPDEFPLSMFYEALAKKLRECDRLDPGHHRRQRPAQGAAGERTSRGRRDRPGTRRRPTRTDGRARRGGDRGFREPWSPSRARRGRARDAAQGWPRRRPCGRLRRGRRTAGRRGGRRALSPRAERRHRRDVVDLLDLEADPGLGGRIEKEPRPGRRPGAPGRRLARLRDLRRDRAWRTGTCCTTC